MNKELQLISIDKDRRRAMSYKKQKSSCKRKIVINLDGLENYVMAAALMLIGAALYMQRF